MTRYCLAVVLAAGLLTFTPKSAYATCSNPAGSEGAMVYNADHSVMQFCNGTYWIAVEGAPPSSSGGNLTGDINASGSGSVTATIPDNTITYPKMQDVSTNNRVLGRLSSGAGDIQEITIGSGLTLSGGVLSASGSDTLQSMTTSARNALSSPANGTMIWNTTTKRFNLRSNGTWVELGDGLSVSDAPSFSFTNQTLINKSTLVTSNTATITLSGTTLPAAVSVTGPGGPQISVNGGAWTSSDSISSGQTLQVRMTSSSSANTTTTATITIGNQSGTWSVTTVPSPTTLTFIASSKGNSSTASVPAGAQPGDLWVIAQYICCTAFYGTNPSGFTVMQENGDPSSAEAKGIISAKIVASGDTTASVQSGNSKSYWVSMLFRGDYTISGFDWNDGSATTNWQNPAAHTVTAASTSSLPVVILGQMGSSGTISPRRTTPTMDELTSTNTTHYVHYQIYNSSPVDQSYDMDDEGDRNITQAGYVRVW